MTRTTLALILSTALGGGAGCGQSDSGVAKTSGLTIVVAVPNEGANGVQGKDLVRAARLELESRQGRVSGRLVRIRQMNESGAVRGGADPEHVASLVEGITDDPEVVGWLGGLDSDSFAVELPRLNEAGIAAVSPGATAIPFNRKDPGFPGAPLKYYPAFDRFGLSMARIATNDLEIGRRALADLRKRRISRVFTVDAGDTDGDSFSSAVEQLAPSVGISLVGHESVVAQNADWDGIAAEARTLGAQAIIWGSAYGVGQVELWRAVAMSNGRQVMVSGPAVPPGQLGKLPMVAGAALSYGPLVPPVLQGQHGRTFTARFKKAYGHSPAPGALRGAAAMGLLLDSLEKGIQLRKRLPDEPIRHLVVRALRETRSSDSLLGKVDLNAAGDWPGAPTGHWVVTKTGVTFSGLLP